MHSGSCFVNGSYMSEINTNTKGEQYAFESFVSDKKKYTCRNS